MSTTKNTGGPAFPVPGLHHDESFNGMTLRDHFAGLAMQGELAAMVDPEGVVCGIKLDAPESTFDRLAAHWYRMADAMLKARSA